MSDYRHYTPEPECLADRVVLVTGATRGIGRAVARDLVVHGATVLLHGRDAAVLEALYQELLGLASRGVSGQRLECQP